ncbi:MAG: SDR family oxidoreductase [Deltaproteobacteria bacterium]|nr:SDR family oxidoreductase [Deltaproteobacteria bacterium]
MDLQGKAAIVSGGGTGVGRATALALARRGCGVVVNYSRSQAEAEETAAEASALGVRALAVQADVADDAACRRLVDTAVRALGRLDVLVNNAGATVFVPLANLDGVSGDDWTRILGVNLIGPFQLARAARAPMEAAGGGAIVNVSSVAGLAGIGSSIPYCASKAGLNVLTLILARTLAPRIRVNAVAPGFITGRWLEGGLGAAYEPVKKAMEARSPLARVCTPEDVAQVILALVADADMVTGQVVPVEGGMLIAG